MLPLLIELGWKSALIAGAALLADRLLRGRPAAERVFVLRLAVLLLLALPAAVLLLPSLDLAWLPAAQAPAQAVPAAAASAPPVPATLPVQAEIDIAGWLYAAGAGAVLLHLAIGIAIVAGWTRRGMPAEDAAWRTALARATARVRRPVRLLVSCDVTTPISWGVAPAWILIDPDTLERTAQADAVLAHEAAHIRRFDWPMLVAARTAVALFWFNPLAWLLGRTLARRGETAADEVAVRGIERADYAEALLTFAAARTTRAAATGMALWPNALAERITHIAMHRQRRGSRVVPVAALVCVALAVPPLAAAKVVHAKSERQVATSLRRAPQHAASAPQGVVAAAIPRAMPETRPEAGGRTTASVDEDVAPQSARAPMSPIDHALATANPMPRPMPQVVVDPQIRIIGRGGAEVATGPGGAAIRAGRPEAQVPPPEAQRSIDEGARSAEGGRRSAIEGRRSAAQGMRDAAASLRQNVASFERGIADPNLPQGVRDGYRNAVREMSEQAAKLEAQAAELNGD